MGKNKRIKSVGFIKPPYGKGMEKTPDYYALCFGERVWDAVTVGGGVATIILLSSVTGKTTHIKMIKRERLKKHTLVGVITLNKKTFYPRDIQSVLIIFKAGVPHPIYQEVHLIDYQDDGYPTYLIGF